MKKISKQYHIIHTDSPEGQQLGFVSNLFHGYLWRDGDAIYVSVIESVHKGQGHLSQLFRAIWAKGYTIKVPTALPNMEAIVQRKGFQLVHEYSKDMGEDVEVWVKAPESVQVAP